MKEETVRVLRVLEYTGPRSKVEDLISRSIHGEKKVGGVGEFEITIRAATIGSFPEILEGANHAPSDRQATEGDLPDHRGA